MDPVAAARAFVEELFPGALYAFVGGSVLTGLRTATSDLDVVVVLDGLPAPYRESLRWREWPVELFAHSETSLAVYVDDGFEQRRPVLARICAEGAVVTDRTGGRASDLQSELADRLADGPSGLTDGQADRFRYVLSDLLDDLSGATDPGERAFIGWEVVQAAARTALGVGRAWQGSGKWLLRELRAHDAKLADELLDARDDPARLAAVATDVLERAGGRLWEGYRTQGDPFHQPLRHVPSGALSGETAQSGGMRRLAAVSGATTGSSRLWMGQTHVAPATRSSDHHHGASETAIYVVSGTPSFVFLEEGRERRIDAGPGDYVFVPPYVPHREENPDPSHEAVVVIARSTQEAVVVNLPDLRQH
ncbi:cupin domain-containing protein [Nonomuraea rubra]|uniref:Putative RmlC-like cupin family protein n=1 Tax=Nonomuraea rubra TaxID=46180 RepID=A0A7X0NSJ1_9ACTN|nr:cupin domain-containing protein [Nonomuraea rubra]MBB6548816.1 putative RmlC-like cupin family protein [Nonomuraea rubra]